MKFSSVILLIASVSAIHLRDDNCAPGGDKTKTCIVAAGGTVSGWNKNHWGNKKSEVPAPYNA